MIWEAILLFLLKLESRRQITWLLRKHPQAILSHLQQLTKMDLSHIETIAGDDAVADLLCKVKVEQLQRINQNMVRHLIRNRVLEPSRLLDRYYMIAVDGTGLFHRHQRHCPHCIVSKSSSGELLYSHSVLEAKLVTPYGLALSIASEHVENQGNETFDLSDEKQKQDCEIKAFKRLAPQIKSAFPQLPICLLVDSLYAAEPVMQICNEYGWAYTMSFKEGKIPSLAQDSQRIEARQSENRKTLIRKEVRQEISWATDIDYRGYVNHLIRTVETTESTNAEIPTEKVKNFVFITNVKPNTKTVDAIANLAGRQRWKIENQGFNTQKNGGYNLEHVYSHNETAAKCFYVLLQIAHIINQLIEKGSLIKAICKKYGSIKNLTLNLREALRFICIQPQDIQALTKHSFQIRLGNDSS